MKGPAMGWPAPRGARRVVGGLALAAVLLAPPLAAQTSAPTGFLEEFERQFVRREPAAP